MSKSKLGDYLTGKVKMVAVTKENGERYIAMKGIKFNTDIEVGSKDKVIINDGKWQSETKLSKKKPKKGGK